MTPVSRIVRALGGHPREDALLDYAEGASPDAARIEAHLATCERCRDSVAAMREMRRALRSLGEVEAPRSFRLTPAMVERTPRRAPGRTYPVAQLAGALAVVLFAGLVAFDVATSRGPSREMGGAPEAASDTARTFAEAVTPEAPMAAAAGEPTASPPAEGGAALAPQESAPKPAPAPAGEPDEGGGRLPLRVAEGVVGAATVSILVWLVLSRRARSAARGP
ncbi:MAG TPA: zf-HC2 domain-containing protein [Dehalococcoidia bacterium]|nr:zf-HC2 domain-containing protein [Dehalococcoidia bacterium]